MINRVLPDPSDPNFGLGFYSGEPAAWATATNGLTDDQSTSISDLETGAQQQADLAVEKTYLNTVVTGYITLGYVPILGGGATWLGVAQNRLNFLIAQAANHLP